MAKVLLSRKRNEYRLVATARAARQEPCPPVQLEFNRA
jgi:hypothetical protein